MRRLIPLVLLAFAVLPARAQAPAPGDVVVNEISYDPPAPQPSTNEWVEVVNRSGAAVDLAGLRIVDSANGTSAAVGGPLVVPPGGFAVFGRDAAAFSAAYPGVPFTALASFPTLNNTGDTVRLTLGGADLDAVPYLASWGGTDASLERRDPAGPSTSASNFGTTVDPARGTPGRQNSIFAADVTGPTLVSASASADGRTVTVLLDEPAEPATVTASAFTVSGATVTAAAYDGARTVALTLAAPLPGNATVTATGLRDATGNTTATTSTTVAFTPDTLPPGLAAASALSETTVEVAFTEPVTVASAQNAAAYTVDGGVGAPVSVTVEPGAGGAVGATLTFAAPFVGPRTFTLTATGLTDLAGNTQPGTAATFFFGQFDTPAPRDIVVNEIVYDPPPGQPSTNEWVELVNRTADRTFDLAALRFADAAGNPVPITTATTALGPGGFAVVGRDAAAFAAAYPGVPFVQVAGFPTLNNDADTPAILLADGTVLDAVPYRASWGGTDASLERKDPNGPSTSARNFATSTDPARATPGRQNSVFAPDVVGPRLVSATVSPDGRTVTVVLDEPTDPATVTAAAFAVTGASVTAAVYDDAALTVVLTLATPLAAGAATVTATGLRDGLGNTTATTSTTVAFTPDVTPPGIAAAFPETATTVRIIFTEPVTLPSAQNPAAYSLDGGVGAPTAVAVEQEDGAAVAVVLTLGAALVERQVYTLTASGLVDLAGNVQTGTSTAILFGQTDTPVRGELVVTEIMYDPRTGDSEYIEVLNTTTDRFFGLRTVTLDDGDPADADPLSDTPALVLPGQYAMIVRDGASFAARFPGVPFTVLAGLSLSNSGEAVVLRAGGATVDSVAYTPDWQRADLDDASGIALERRDAAGPSNTASNWSSSLDESGGTPGRANSLSIAGPPVERGDAITVTSPFAPDDGEAARITYTLDAPAALVRVRIFDGGGRLVREVEDGRLSGSTGTVEWDGTGDDRRRLRTGIYVVLLEAVDTAGGTTEAHRAAIVLARR